MEFKVVQMQCGEKEFTPGVSPLRQRASRRGESSLDTPQRCPTEVTYGLAAWPSSFVNQSMHLVLRVAQLCLTSSKKCYC